MLLPSPSNTLVWAFGSPGPVRKIVPARGPKDFGWVSTPGVVYYVETCTKGVVTGGSFWTCQVGFSMSLFGRLHATNILTSLTHQAKLN